jgi:lysophospholipase L1-like esterase
MNWLLIGDSNCVDLAPYLKSVNYIDQVYVTSVGSSINATLDQYNNELHYIASFDPGCCILHCGHNDLAVHDVKNPTPSTSFLARDDLIDMAKYVQRDFPTAIVAISSVLPRSYTPTSTLSKPEVEAFNRTVKRLGQRIRAASEPIGFVTLLNNRFWRRISKSQEEATLLDGDGLHLSELGKKAITQDWADTLKPHLIAPASMTTMTTRSGHSSTTPIL